MKLWVLDEADAETIDTANWYEDRSPGLGYDFHTQVERAFARIIADPLRHARVEFTRVDGDVRRVLLDRFPYAVVYQILDNGILVLAVCRASRDQDYWKGPVRDS